MKKRILFPMPTYGGDPSEIAVPWKLLTEQGHEVIFSTPRGEKARADEIMITGKGLGIFKGILRARKDARIAYAEMEKNAAFCKPTKYEDLKEADFDAIFLPGGHDKGVKEYLESKVLQDLIVQFFKSNKPVAGICHGILLIARSIDRATGKSVIANYKTTSLLKTQELAAFNLTRLWLGDYYLTYPEITTQDEVTSFLETKANFVLGSRPIAKDRMDNLKAGFVVRDRNYLSARWPGDLYSLTTEFIDMLKAS
jgi:protease I